MRQTIAAACCLVIIAVAGFADKPLKEPTPAPQTLTTLETNVVTPAESPDCRCENCTCDPCECWKNNPDCAARLRNHEYREGIKNRVKALSDRHEATHPRDTKPVAARESGETIYFFTADWCQPCRAMKPLTGRLHAEGHTCYTVDFDTRQDLVSKYGVTSVPQFVVVDGERVVRRVVGTTTRERVLGLEPTTQTMFPTPGTWSQPAYSEPTYQVQQPQRTGWFRGRMTRSVCGPGGCR